MILKQMIILLCISVFLRFFIFGEIAISILWAFVAAIPNILVFFRSIHISWKYNISSIFFSIMFIGISCVDFASTVFGHIDFGGAVLLLIISDGWLVMAACVIWHRIRRIAYGIGILSAVILLTPYNYSGHLSIVESEYITCHTHGYYAILYSYEINSYVDQKIDSDIQIPDQKLLLIFPKNFSRGNCLVNS